MDPSTNPSVAVTQRKRRRPALACEQCRRRKVKCDRTYPCDQCTKTKSSACTYVPDERSAPYIRMRNGDSRRSLSPSSDSPATPSESPTYSEMLSTISAFGPRVSQVPTTSVSPAHTEGPARVREVDLTFGLEQSLIDRVKSLERKVSQEACSRSSEPNLASPSRQEYVKPTSPSLKGVFSKTRFFGQSHWMNNSQQYDKVVSLWRNVEADKSSTTGILLDKCKELARIAKTKAPIHQSMLDDFRAWVPPRELCDKLVRAYLRTFESIYRVLHTPTFQQEYHQYWIHPQAANDAFVIKLLLVMAIGTCFYQDPVNSTSLRASSSKWIYGAQAWLISPCEKSRINLSGLQIQCLLLLARQANAISADLVWISAGSLLRTAIQMALHRDPSHLPKMPVFHAEMRKRLWATVMEITVQSSMDSGGPPLISCQDFDCTPPSNINDHQIDETTKVPPIVKPAEIMTQTSVQIALMKSFPLRLEVARLVNDFRSEPTFDDVLRLSAELTSIYRSSSPSSRSARTDPGQQPTVFQTRLLDLLTHRFLFALHHPFALKARTNPTYYFSRKVCLESSLSILSDPPSAQSLTATTSNSTIVPLEDDYTRLKHVGSGVFRGVLIHAAFNIGLELISQLQEDSSCFTSESNFLHRKELHKALEGYVELTAARIRAGETNVKGHTFFSCVLAQVNALDAGTSQEQGILRALKKSAETSYELLKARTDDGIDLGGGGEQQSSTNGAVGSTSDTNFLMNSTTTSASDFTPFPQEIPGGNNGFEWDDLNFESGFSMLGNYPMTNMDPWFLAADGMTTGGEL